MNCENCNKVHDGSYGSGRFCTQKCARSFSTSKNRKEINRKVSETLGGPGLTRKEQSELSRLSKQASYERKKKLTSILDVSKRTTQKILKRMKLPCSLCGWFYEGVSCDLHHIVPRSSGGSDENTNLTYICPNCHRLVHTGHIPIENLITLQDYIGESWKDYYFVKHAAGDGTQRGL